jgi:hypothetical protein
MSTATALTASKRIANYLGQNARLTPAQCRRIRHKSNRAVAAKARDAYTTPSKRKRRTPIKPRLMYGGYGIHQVPPNVYGDEDK